MHYAIQDFVHKTLGTRSVPACGHALRGFMHNDLMHCENFICISLIVVCEFGTREPVGLIVLLEIDK